MNKKEKNINIDESIKIQDNDKMNLTRSPIKGMVRIYNNNNELIYEKHNMVVFTGRQLLLDLFKNYFIEDSSKVSGHLFAYLSYIDDKYVKTRKDLTLDEIKTDFSIKREQVIIPNDSNFLDKVELSEDYLKYTIQMEVSVTEEFQKINQIYLTYSNVVDGQSGEEILFSRVALDPIFLGSDSKYKIAYTLYF